MALYAEGIAQSADEIIKFRHDFVTCRLVGQSACGRLIRVVVKSRNGARFRDLSGNSVECRFKAAQSRAGVLVFRHEPLVYRLCNLTGSISTGQGSNVKDFEHDSAGARRCRP